LWTYDVWGNARDGWQVNDSYDHGTIDVACYPTTYNVPVDGSPAIHGFTDWSPTDRRLSRAAEAQGVTWEGDPDHALYAEDYRNGRPAGELEFVGWVVHEA
jgi:hypothetical protein